MAFARRLGDSVARWLSLAEGVSKCTFWIHPRRCVRMAKMQGAEDEGAGSVLKYMTKPESDSNAADWLL